MDCLENEEIKCDDLNTIPNTKIIAWDVGTRDLAMCCVEIIGWNDQQIPIVKIRRWEMFSLTGKTLINDQCASLVMLMNSLRDFLQDVKYHIIEIQFNNPTMKVISFCIQCLTLQILSDSSINPVVRFMGSGTKFSTFQKKINITFPHDTTKAESNAKKYAMTKKNSVFLCEFLLDISDLSTEKEFLLKQKQGKRDDYADCFGLAITYAVKNSSELKKRILSL